MESGYCSKKLFEVILPFMWLLNYKRIGSNLSTFSKITKLKRDLNSKGKMLKNFKVSKTKFSVHEDEMDIGRLNTRNLTVGKE